MTWVLESPFTILTVGAVVEIMLLIGLVRSGRGLLLGMMGLVLAATLLLLLVERLIVTDRERVAMTLDEIAAVAERNDLPGVLTYISDAAPQTVARVRAGLPQFVVQEARIGDDLSIRFDRSGGTPIAMARFTARVTGHSRRGDLPYENFIGRFKVTLRREGERWRVTDYEVRDSR